MPLPKHTSEEFAKHIEHQVGRGYSYLEAVIAFCEERQIEPESVVKLLNDKIRTKLSEEGQNLHLLTKHDGLPL
jgi:hypothetical protein